MNRYGYSNIDLHFYVLGKLLLIYRNNYTGITNIKEKQKSRSLMQQLTDKSEYFNENKISLF